MANTIAIPYIEIELNIPVAIQTLPLTNGGCRVFKSMVCVIAVLWPPIGNSNQDAIRTNPYAIVGNVAGLGRADGATFGRIAYNRNGSVDTTHKSKSFQDVFEEEHDVEIVVMDDDDGFCQLYYGSSYSLTGSIPFGSDRFYLRSCYEVHVHQCTGKYGQGWAARRIIYR